MVDCCRTLYGAKLWEHRLEHAKKNMCLTHWLPQNFCWKCLTALWTLEKFIAAGPSRMQNVASKDSNMSKIRVTWPIGYREKLIAYDLWCFRHHKNTLLPAHLLVLLELQVLERSLSQRDGARIKTFCTGHSWTLYSG